MTKQHDIKEIFPFLKEGWVACDKCGAWCWYEEKPKVEYTMWWGFGCEELHQFNIAPYSGDWKDSLMKVEVAE